MALFSSLVDNTYRRLLDVKRDSPVLYRENNGVSLVFLSSSHPRGGKKKLRREFWPIPALIRFKVGENNFSEGSRFVLFLSTVSRKRQENFSIFRFRMGPQKVLSTFPNVYQVRKAIVRFVQLIKCFIRTTH